MRVRAALLVLLAVASCRGTPLGTGAVPDESPYIAGTILERDTRFANRSSMLVEAPPAGDGVHRRAEVLIDGDPRVLRRDGSGATVADLQPGRRVSVWKVGPELQSLPPVVTADVVVIER